MLSGNQNSRIEIHLGVIRNLLDDLVTTIENSPVLSDQFSIAYVRKQVAYDLSYIVGRTTNEGISFLTTTLPLLGKWYDGYLSGTWSPPPDGFKPYKLTPSGQRMCPRFLHLYFEVISSSGSHTSDHARAIRVFRSLLFLFYKLETSLSTEQLTTALKKWENNELELEEFELPTYYSKMAMLARKNIVWLLQGRASLFERIDPRHGPGAVAGGEIGDEKWEKPTRYRTLHSVYAWYDMYLAYRSNGSLSPDRVRNIALAWSQCRKLEEPTSRLLFVPKDSRGPRVISCEPKELMFVQQGVARNLMRQLEHRSNGRINFVDQNVNADLALRASARGQFATIDLEDASDRVSTKLVELLFPDWSLKFLRATRSTLTLLPDGREVRHRKYAPMGSALCFPIESAIFWAISAASLELAGLTEESARSSVYVYGDDIICPSDLATRVCDDLTTFGLKVNRKKTYIYGPFRESCGCDALNGHVITPFKIKKDPSRRSLDGLLAKSICDMASRCFAFDLRKTGEYLIALVEAKYPGVIQYYKPLPGLSVLDPLAVFPKGSNARETRCDQRVWIWDLTVPKVSTHLDGEARLAKNLYGNWQEHDPSQVVVPRATKIRKRRILVEG